MADGCKLRARSQQLIQHDPTILTAGARTWQPASSPTPDPPRGRLRGEFIRRTARNCEQLAGTVIKWIRDGYFAPVTMSLANDYRDRAS
jgi:hypothetical protein